MPASPVPEKTRYTDEELEEFRVLIVEKLKKAKEQLQFFNKQLSDMSDNDITKINNLEDGTGADELEQITQLAERQKTLIKHLENALVRIQNKVYGICRTTGKLIPKERLLAVPHATLSVEAKKRGK
jgi:RNA polymerase-binding transcription factor DksA